MAGRNPYQAVRAFLDPIQGALSRIVSAKLTLPGDGYEPPGDPHALTINEGQPVRLPGPVGLSLVDTLHYRIVEGEGERGPWKVQGAAYAYALRLRDREMLSYHWHPGPHNRVPWPHVHVGSEALRDGIPLTRRAHLPTRRVALEQVLWLAVELGVEPRHGDWEQVLHESRERFEQWQTWA